MTTASQYFSNELQPSFSVTNVNDWPLFSDENYEIIRLQWAVGEIAVIQEKKEHFFLSTQPRHYSSEMGRRRAPTPLFSQPKHLKIDSRTEISHLPRDRWLSTYLTNPSLNCFAVKPDWWTAIMWARIILNRTFHKDQVLNSYNAKVKKGWHDVISALPCLWCEECTQECLKNLIYNVSNQSTISELKELPVQSAVLYGTRAKYNLGYLHNQFRHWESFQIFKVFHRNIHLITARGESFNKATGISTWSGFHCQDEIQAKVTWITVNQSSCF